MVASRSGIGKLVSNGGGGLPWLAAMIDISLRPQQIWDGLDVAGVMSGSDRGFRQREATFVIFVVVVMVIVVVVSSLGGWVDLTGGSVLRGSDPPIEPHGATVMVEHHTRCSVGVLQSMHVQHV
ncbi:hypothetical protein ACLOJK_003360 [Asimina triloba]